VARVLGVVATKATHYDAYLVRSQHDLGAGWESHRWGIATASDDGWSMQRSVQTGVHGTPLYGAPSYAKSKILLAHLRLVPATSECVTQPQPLRFGGWAFVHDGRPRDAHARPGDEPETDVIFATLLHSLSERGVLEGDPIGLADRAISDAVIALSSRAGTGSLNFLLSNGSLLYAFRFGRPLYQLIRNPIIGMPRHVAFASEPLTRDPWSPIPDGTLIRAINRSEPPLRIAECRTSPSGGWVH